MTAICGMMPLRAVLPHDAQDVFCRDELESLKKWRRAILEPLWNTKFGPVTILCQDVDVDVAIGDGL